MITLEISRFFMTRRDFLDSFTNLEDLLPKKKDPGRSLLTLSSVHPTTWAVTMLK